MAHFKQSEERLVRFFMSSWQRRGCSLLQVGLHSYIAPEFFWDAGFDVCATDENIHALNYALEISGPRVEYQLAKVDHLPFDDDSFDYAFFTCYASPHYKNMKATVKESKMGKSRLGQTKAEELKNEKLDSEQVSERSKFLTEKKGRLPQEREELPAFLENASFKSLFGNISGESTLFSEACRVAQKGVIILCKNRLSIRHLPPLGNKINPWSLWKIAKKTFPQGDVKFATLLSLPHFIQKRFNIIDVQSHVLPFGELVGVCINFNAAAVTGLGALNKATNKKELVEEPIVNRANVRNK